MNEGREGGGEGRRVRKGGGSVLCETLLRGARGGFIMCDWEPEEEEEAVDSQPLQPLLRLCVFAVCPVLPPRLSAVPNKEPVWAAAASPVAALNSGLSSSKHLASTTEYTHTHTRGGSSSRVLVFFSLAVPKPATNQLYFFVQSPGRV